MEFFKSVPNINFYRLRKSAAGFSILLCLLSIISLCVFRLNLGLDFTGGTQLQLSFEQAADLNQVRLDLKKAGFDREEVQSFGDSKTIVVTLSSVQTEGKSPEEIKAAQDQLTQQVLQAIPNAHFDGLQFIGSKVSSELAYKGILAVIVAMLATMIYIAFRFEWRLAVSAAVALIHDPILILGVFSFFHIEFDLTSLAAVLTIIGYSLHGTIVVFDRVRENFRKIRRGTPIEITNASINQTLLRTIISAMLTMVVVVVLFYLGGPVIHAFSLALIIGIVVGTYSSIYVAGSLSVALGLSRKDLLPPGKKDYDEMP
jgi:preprotein translocase subunit SecF